jgi:Ca-activated chloride channel family protein
VAVGQVNGRSVGLIGFDLGESDLPLQVAFPLLMSNLTEVLLPAVEGILPSSMRLGETTSVVVDPRIERVRIDSVGAPDLPGTASAATEVSVVGGRLTIPGAELVGLREVRAISEEPDLSDALLGATAINLFSTDESDVAPGDPQRIIEMGRVTAGDEPASQPTRAEWWWPLALAALALLAVEWLLFHRPTRRSLARAFRGRLAPLSGRAR